MATDVKDVTASHQSDLTKYGSQLPEGKTLEEVTDGYVYEIVLNPKANGKMVLPSLLMTISTLCKCY